MIVGACLQAINKFFSSPAGRLLRVHFLVTVLFFWILIATPLTLAVITTYSISWLMPILYLCQFLSLENCMPVSKAGTPIPINDVWIASHAMETGSVVITYDKHFNLVPGLRVW